MINEERFWESAIAEAVRNQPAPDVTARVLAGLAAPEPIAVATTSPARGRLRPLRLLGELAIAAAVVFAIGWLTGLLRMPQTPVSGTSEPKNIAAAPGASYEHTDGVIALHDGWILLSTEAPELRCGDSILTQVDGQVLAHAAGVPTREQAEAVSGWLQANRLELEMIMQTRRWVKAAGLAALVLSGSALLDGQRISAQDDAKLETVRWHTVRTVMDVDKLPADARWVRGERVSGAHLEFLAARDGVEAIDFSGCESLRGDHIRSLAALKSLRVLELRGAQWDGSPEYGALTALTGLTRLSVDYLPDVMTWPSNYPPEGWEASFGVTEALRELSARGVQVTLGNLSSITGAQLSMIARNVTTLRELNLVDNWRITDADMKALSEHKSLQSLNLWGCSSVTELGIAYLAKKNQLRSLILSPELTEAILYQLSRMTNLENLDLPQGLNDQSLQTPQPVGERMRNAFTQLAGLNNLRRLAWDLPREAVADDFAPLAKMKALTSLSLRYGWDGNAMPDVLVQIAAVVPVKSFEFDCPALAMVTDGYYADDEESLARFTRQPQNKTLTELSLVLYCGVMPDKADEPGLLPALLAKFPSVKRVTLTIDDAASLAFMQQYTKRHLPDHQVDIVVQR